MTKYILGGISVPPGTEKDEVIAAAAKKLRRAGIPAARLTIWRRSVDARKQNDIRIVYAVLFETPGTLKKETVEKHALLPASDAALAVSCGTTPLGARPIVVGMGPCGMFAALLLAEHGYRPLLIERGGDVADRVRTVEAFYAGGALDPDCSVQFGAGGAGTFSDGKLVTRIGDAHCSYVLSRFAAFGAPAEILTNAKPHIGTDVLRDVVSNIAQEITRLGGEILYRTRFLGYDEPKDGVRRIRTTRGDFETSALVLAIGHSARDTYAMLLDRGCAIEAKDFSVGMRIEHKKADIDRALYGALAGSPDLPYAEYNLSANTKTRGVYTFCMCPGGEVVSGASEAGGLCVNGMSRYARDGENSNSAVCVSVFRNDYGATPADAIAYQRSLERAAFRAGGENYNAPVCTVKDFVERRRATALGRVRPTYMNGRVTPADLSALFPTVLYDALAGGLAAFGRKIRGFDAPDALLTGLETRTSAPLRILRGENLTMLGTEDIYPGGEGAGYAGGITSAAVDGVKIALAIMAKFAPMA